MKSEKLVRAYENLRPDAAAKERMLQKILLSSEIPAAGKDEPVMRRKLRPLVIAAIIGIMMFLMGCAVISLRLQDLKIGEITTGKGQVLDSEGNVVKESELHGDVISLHGITDSATYRAHQEWYEFYNEYSENHEITQEENLFIPPEEYEAYSAYNQELMDKVDEIAEKYQLKLLGAFAPFSRSEKRIFYQATGIDTLLASDSVVKMQNESGYFYQGGNFKVEFDLKVPQDWENWPSSMSNSIYYSKADYFDTIYYVIGNMEAWEQWEFTTSRGEKLLITRSKSGLGVRIFHVRKDAVLFVSLNGYYDEINEAFTGPTNQQIEKLAEQFDYSITVQSVDMDLVKENLQKFTQNAFLEDNEVVNDSIDAIIAERIARLKTDEAQLFCALTDINADGKTDLIIGTRDKIESVWMDQYGQVNRIMEYGENYKKLKDAWPDMEKMPIEEFASR